VTPSVESALAVVRDLALEVGIVEEPVVVADRSNLVLRLGEVVARVAMATSLVRVGMEWLGREIALTRFIDARGGGVTRPARSIEAGPFERDGLVVSFWEREDLVAERAGPRAAGAELARIHRILRDAPEGIVQRWGNMEEARLVLDRARQSPFFDAADRLRLERAWSEAERTAASAEARTASFQPVHGDAHIGNVLATARGALWTDWEDAFLGPVEWDVACLRSKAELFGEEREPIEHMLAAYDAECDVQCDAELARELGVVRNLQVVLWLAVFAERHPELLPRMRARLDRLP